MTQRARQTVTANKRLAIAALIGIAMGAVTIIRGEAQYASLAMWDTIAAIYVTWSLYTVLRFSPEETRTHAKRENPNRAITDLVLIFASLASLVAVGILVFQASSSTGSEKVIDIGLGLLSVIASWSVVHTTYLLIYARLYYGSPEGGIDFNDRLAPKYSDFAYLAFTVGMTFQVSDTIIKAKPMRTAVLKHALLSFVFGTVIIATTINTLASLSQ